MVTSRRRPIGRRWSTARSCRRGTTRRFTCTARLSTHPDAESTLAAVRMLTAHFEADRAEPWADTETHQRTTSRAYFEQSSPSRSPVDRIEANKSSPKTAPSPTSKASSSTSQHEDLRPMLCWPRCNPSYSRRHQVCSSPTAGGYFSGGSMSSGLRSNYLPSAAVTFSRPLTERSLVVASATDGRWALLPSQNFVGSSR